MGEPPFLGAAVDTGGARLFDLLAKLEPRDDAAATLNGMVAEVGDDTGDEKRTGRVTRALANFVEERHDPSESQGGREGQPDFVGARSAAAPA